MIEHTEYNSQQTLLCEPNFVLKSILIVLMNKSALD